MEHPLPVRRRQLRTLAGAAYGSLALVDTALAAGPTGWHRARLVTKPLLMPALMVRTLTGPGTAGPLTVAAQGLSWGGDVALLRHGRGSFLAGTGSFLAAHLAYIAAHRSRSSTPVLATAGRRRLLAAGVVGGTGLAIAAARQERMLGVPVATYGATLATMVTAAAAVDPERGRSRILAGAVLFLVSDTLLGNRLFVLDQDAPLLEAGVMATYTAAQWWLAEGLAQAAAQGSAQAQ